ncbi:PLDc N-terminal domain-containing protein [Thalassospira sp. MA62]|nr:PLDc N-terminal domain-containing protein [Thalassospira sp. MA62]
MFEYGGILGLIILIADIWAIVNIMGSGASTGSKVLWTVLVVVLPVVGLIIWLFAGPRSGRVSA